MPPTTNVDKLTVEALGSRGILDELARVFDREASAVELLDEVGFPRERRPIWGGSPLAYWREVCRELEHGLIAEGLGKLVTEAARLYPGNPTLQLAARPGTRDGERRIFSVPYPRNTYFTGREDVLAALHGALTRDGSAALSQAIAISGLGGVGKTQTAVEYAYRHAGEYRTVLFVRAETEATIIDGFTEIAAALGLPRAVAGDQEVTTAAAREWLENEDGWLLIFDNADRPQLLQRFLPHHPRGHVVVTSRAQVFDVLGIAEPLRVRTLPPGEARDLLLKRGGRREPTAPERGAAAQLAEELGYLPLALEQAGAYVLQKKVRFADYLAAYRRLGLDTLERQAPVIEGHPDSVAGTWTLNFLEVEQISPAAADVLRANAFVAPDDVPEELLTKGGGELGLSVGDDPLALAEILEPLTRYSLLQRDPEEKTWSVHRLVQEVVKASLGEDGRKHWVERVVRALGRAFPRPNFPSWPVCGRLLPHVLVAVSSPGAKHLEIAETADLLSSAARYLNLRARYTEAEPLFERARRIFEKALGSEHPKVATVLNYLAELYRNQGRLADAESLYERSREIREKTLGKEHPDVATSLDKLATLHHLQGRLVEAETLCGRARAIREKALGKEHPDVAASLYNLANLYSAQGRLAEAEPLYDGALRIREKALAAEHPDVANSVDSLANLYHAQGRLAEAEPLYERALKIREKTLGKEHPDVGHSFANLANLYSALRRFAEAEPLYGKALKIHEKAFGEEHPFVANTLNSLANLYHAQGRLAEAEPLFARALEIREKALGVDHPDVARARYSLANLRHAQGRLAEAKPLYESALKISEKALGEEHPDVAAALESYAGLLRNTGRVAEADETATRARKIRERLSAREEG